MEFERVESNATAKHVKEKGHKIEWDKAVVLEKEKGSILKEIDKDV